MSGPSTALWITLIGGAAIGLFQLKHAVQERENDLAVLNRELLASEENIHVLRAEWSYLNRPARLAGLASRHLDLEPISAAQIIGVGALPLRVDEGDAPPAGRRVLTGMGTAP